MVDAADPDRFEESADELQAVMEVIESSFMADGEGSTAGKMDKDGSDGGEVSAAARYNIDSLAPVPIAILVNKVDLSHSLPVSTVAKQLGLLHLNPDVDIVDRCVCSRAASSSASLSSMEGGASTQGGKATEGEEEPIPVEYNGPLRVFGCSVLRNEGFDDAFKWIASFL